VQRAEISGDAKVRIVSTEYDIEVVHLLPNRQVPHPPHQVLQAHERTPQSRPFRAHPNPKVAFLIARAIQRKAQKIDRLRTLTAVLTRMSVREATKFDELGLSRFQCQVKLPQSLAQRFLDPKSIRPILETHHKVVDVPHQVGLAL
jgi:hypothetical protein